MSFTAGFGNKKNSLQSDTVIDDNSYDGQEQLDSILFKS